MITGKLIRDVEVMFRKITEKKTAAAVDKGADHQRVWDHHLTCKEGGVSRIINDMNKSCDRMEDEIREHAIMQDIYEEDDQDESTGMVK